MREEIGTAVKKVERGLFGGKYLFKWTSFTILRMGTQSKIFLFIFLFKYLYSITVLNIYAVILRNI